MSKWSVGYFEWRGNWGAFESDSDRKSEVGWHIMQVEGPYNKAEEREIYKII